MTIPQAIEIIASMQYLDRSSLGALPSAEESHLTKVKLLSWGRLYLMMDWSGQREEGVVRDKSIKSWPPHPKLRQLWRATLVSVLAMVWAVTFVPTFVCCSVLLHSLPSVVLILRAHSLIKFLHTNLLLRDCFLGKLFCNSDT